MKKIGKIALIVIGVIIALQIVVGCGVGAYCGLADRSLSTDFCREMIQK